MLLLCTNNKATFPESQDAIKSPKQETFIITCMLAIISNTTQLSDLY